MKYLNLYLSCCILLFFSCSSTTEQGGTYGISLEKNSYKLLKPINEDLKKLKNDGDYNKDQIEKKEKEKEAILKDRQMYISLLIAEYKDLNDISKINKNKSMNSRRGKYSTVRISITATGVAVGIGTAVAAVTGPAALTAGLGAASAGLITLQNSYDDEGLKSDRIDSAITAFTKAFKDESDIFTDKINSSIANINDDDKFILYYGQAQASILKLKNILTTDYTYLSESKTASDDSTSETSVTERAKN